MPKRLDVAWRLTPTRLGGFLLASLTVLGQAKPSLRGVSKKFAFGAASNVTDSQGRQLDGNATHGNTQMANNVAGGHEGEHVEHEEHVSHVSPSFSPVLFVLVAFASSAICQQVVVVLPPWMRPPHSVMLYVAGTIMARVADSYPDTEFGIAVRAAYNIDPHFIFWVLLPPLLYEDASGCDWHVFRRVLGSSLVLAFPGVILNTVLTGVFLTLCLGMELKPALLTGSILSATDPVAVIGALTALQAPAKLSSIISGESLLNDGSAVVLFQIFLGVAAGRTEFHLGEAIEKLLRLSLGGPALGLAFGIAAQMWLKSTRKFTIEILVIFVSVYACFFTAEHHSIEVSGVLAVATFGFFMASTGKYSLSIVKEHEHHAVASFLAYISNEAIFVIAGVVGYNFSFETEGASARDWLDLFILYLGIHLTRSIVMCVSFPLLNRIGYRLQAKEAIICVFGGLRGAVGLAMALIVMGDTGMNLELRRKIAFHTNGIVIGTLFINGILIVPLYRKLHIVPASRSEEHDAAVKVMLLNADATVKKRIAKLRTHWFFKNTPTDLIDELVPSLASAMDLGDKDFYGQRELVSIRSKSVVGVLEKLTLQMADDDHEAYVQAKLYDGEDFNFFLLEDDEPQREATMQPIVEEQQSTAEVTRRLSTSRRYAFKHFGSGIVDPDRRSALFVDEGLRTLIHVRRAAYKQMLEAHSIDNDCYTSLWESCEFQEEAGNGDLKNYRFLRAELPDLHTSSPEAQLHNSIQVAWQYLVHGGTGRLDAITLVFHRIVSWFGGRSVTVEWMAMNNKLKAMLAFTLSTEHDAREMEEVGHTVFDTSTSKAGIDAGVIDPLKSMYQECKTRTLSELAGDDPVLFRLAEQMLFARLVVVQQKAVIDEIAEMGELPAEDAEDILENMLLPTLAAISTCMPTKAMLEKARSKRAGSYATSLDWFIKLAVYLTHPYDNTRK